ncbi:MAG: MarR family winged helix-turn-helix transcriptional regulator [Deltaproteobacteria bacterium]
MQRVHLPFFDQNSEALDRRIAKGLHKIGLALKHQTWLQASEEGLSPTQGQILAALATDGPLTGSELAKRLGITLPTISDSVRVLVEKSFAIKKPDERHPRASLIELTASGQRIAAKTKTWPEFLATAVSALTPTELEAFNTGLIKMITVLQEAGQIPTNRMCVNCTSFRPRVHEGPMPHHCTFVDAPMADRHLRIDCAEHTESTKAERALTWRTFAAAT